MSKSLGNYIGVSDKPEEIFGKIMSVSDKLMLRYYALLTSVPETDIETMQKDIVNGRIHPMDAKKQLARIVIGELYSPGAAEKAQDEFVQVFSEKKLPTEMEEHIWDGEPSVWIIKLMEKTGMVDSKSEGRRLV
jgi:tyrosyl-tRNA synthetase